MNELRITIEEWLAALRQAGRSPSTIIMYNWHLDRLAGWLEAQDITETQGISKRLLRQWGASLYNDNNWSASTVKQAVSAAKSFLLWCREEEVINEPLHKALKTPKVKVAVQKTATLDEVKALIGCCCDSEKGLRDAAIVSLLVDSGLRASEVCRLRVSDLQIGMRLGEGFVNILVVLSKGGATLPAYFGQATAERLERWLAIRGRVARPGVEAVFVGVGGTKPGTAITRHGLRALLYQLSDKAGIRRLSPHTLRRAFACLATDAGANSRQVQEWGRWSNIELVERYTMAYQAGQRYAAHSPIDYIQRQNGDEAT